jgi:hypothetical protein
MKEAVGGVTPSALLLSACPIELRLDGVALPSENHGRTKCWTNSYLFGQF